MELISVEIGLASSSASLPPPFGWQPTLIEWDNDIPPLATIFAEADKATRVASNAIAGARRHAVTR
jgi:uncharacterized protein (UPF0276 family)